MIISLSEHKKKTSTAERKIKVNTNHVEVMFHLNAFCYIPDKDIAIVACRQHYPGIEWMGLQHKYFICMSLFEHKNT